MVKNRRKKRRKKRGGQAAVPPLPRPSRARNQGGGVAPGCRRRERHGQAVRAHKAGDIVSGIVTDVVGEFLHLDIDGMLGIFPLWELDPIGGERTQDRYTVGDTINGLFVLPIIVEGILLLSVKRNAPGYVEALRRRTVGEITSGTITQVDDDISGDGIGLELDIDGLVGIIHTWDLALADGESASDRYAIGDTIDGLFVWSVNHKARNFYLSVKRNAPGYVEALNTIARGDELDGIVTDASEGGVWLSVAGVVGWIPASEFLLDGGESLQTRYATGDKITARVWQIDRLSRTAILSVRRLVADFPEESVVLGEPIDAAVRGTTSRDIPMPIRVLADDHEVWIPAHELALTTGTPTPFGDGEVVRPVVVEVDEDGRPTRLSLRRALNGWDTATERLSASNFLVPNARIVPREAITKTELRDGSAAVDLGPILGLISQEELSLETGEILMGQSSNREYGCVVDSVDREHGFAYVSHDRFEERWRAVAEERGLEEGADIEGELRDFSGFKQEVALLDLGSGLLAQMPARELPDSDPPGKAARDRIGESFSLRITAIDRDKQTIEVEPQDKRFAALIGEPESETLEFKAVLRGSGGRGERRDMTHEAMRTITGFLNTSGGNLVIGVDDDREVVGLESDDGLTGETMAKKIDNANQILEDNMKNVQPLNALDDLDNLRGLVTWATPLVRGRALLAVECQRGPDAGVWLVGKGQPEFWIRRGQETVQLRGRDAIRAHLSDRRQRSATSDEANSDE